MQRVWRGRRDGRVQPRGGEPFLGNGRRVVTVNEIVRHTRMVGIFLEFPLEDGGCLEVCGVGLVGLGLRPGDVERGEDLCLVVARVALRQRLVGAGA